MMRKAVTILLCVLMLLLLPIDTAAAESLPMVVDTAGLLSDGQVQALEEKADALRTAYDLDVIILTVDTLGNATAQEFADAYFDDNGYGYGSEHSGILFLLAMNEREWYISTSGNAMYAFTDYGIQQLGESIVWYLSYGEYYNGFCAYQEEIPAYLESYLHDRPVDGYADYSGDYYHGDRDEVLYYQEDRGPNLVVSLLIGICAAGVAILIMRSKMDTKRKQTSAAGYMTNGAFHLRQHQDLFLYSNVSKTRRQEPSSTSRSGGGSSVHRSSGGRRHGGGGGRF